MTALRTLITRPGHVLAEWEALVDRVSGDPFVRPGWILCWHHAYGRGSLVVAAAYRGDQLVGVLPVRRSPGFTFSPTNWHTPAFGIVAEDDAVARALVHALLERRTWQLQLAFVDDATVGLVEQAAHSAGWTSLSQPMGQSPYLRLEGSFEDYLAGLSRNTRKQLRRRRRDLEARGEVRLDVHEAFEESLFDEFLDVEGSGWKEAQDSAIRSRPRDLGFYREVARWAASAGWLRLAFLRLDGHVVAADLALECGNAHYVLKTGYSPAHESCSPGRLLREEMLRRAFDQGLAEYQLLGQDARWKQSWRPAYRDQYRVQAFAPGPGAVLRPLHAQGRPAARATVHRLRAWRGHR